MATLQCQLSKCEHYYRFFPRPALTRLLMAPTITWAMESDTIRSMGYGKQLGQKYGLRKATRSEVWATESDSIRSMGYGKQLDQKYGLQKATQSEVWATESDSIRSMGYRKHLGQKYLVRKVSETPVSQNTLTCAQFAPKVSTLFLSSLKVL